MLTMIKQKIN